MTDTPLPFAPFQPSPPTQPVAEKPAKAKSETAKSETAKQKAAREKREAKAATKPYPDQTDRVLAAAPRQKRRSTGTPKASKRAPKFDLQTILAAASTLKESDMPAFEKMIGLLQDAGKPGRDRLLAALGKVFA